MAKFRIVEVWPYGKNPKIHYRPEVKRWFLFIPYWSNVCSSIYATVEEAEERIEVYKKFGTKNTIKELD